MVEDRAARSRFAAIVLGAGRAIRMGGTPKLLLPWRDGKPILWHSANAALRLESAQVIVVVRPDLPGLEQALADLPVTTVPNRRFEQGMSTSIVAGIEALPDDIQAALLMLGDEPEVPTRIVDALLEAFSREGKPITIPRYGEEVGPPTLFSRQIFPELLKLTGDAGAKQLVSRYPDMTCFVPFGAEERPRDIDTPEDYRLTR